MNLDHQPATPPEWLGPVPADQVDYAPFWARLRDHCLSIQRCDACGHWIHYPSAMCPSCLASALSFQPVSGEAHVYTFTIVHREFGLHVPIPWIAAIVELVEQPGLRLATNIVNCDPPKLEIGMPVRVIYADYRGDVTLAYFEPIPTEGSR
jgi:uncharacterized OB-fold protein